MAKKTGRTSVKPSMTQTTKMEGVFDNDSTFKLIKKFFVYKLMGSNMFIDYSLPLINVCYKILGIKLTNFAINNSVASLFTSGETIKSLIRDIDEYEK
jgi:hypothetical protein